MYKRNILRYTIFLLLILGLFSSAYASDRSIYKRDYGTEQKVALVIGNKNYTHFKTLKNPIYDARDMRDVLKSKGFKVLYLEDANLEDMEKKVNEFENKLKSGGVGFFYYAGHGLEVKGKNYLIPSPAKISKENEVKYRSLSVDMVIDKMQDSQNRLNIIVLDACRDNPFGDGRSIGGEGLATINNARGMYIAFATSPKKKASDGDGRNGLFTKHLLVNIQKNNLNLDEVFKYTRTSVYKESYKTQLPWTSSSVIGDFYFSLSDSIIIPKPTPKLHKDIVKIGNLMWENQSFTKKYTHSEAKSYCDNLTLGGYSDWRMPTRDELNSLSNINMYGMYDDNWKNWFNKNKDKRATNSKGESHFIRKEFLEKMPKKSWFWTFTHKNSFLFWVICFDDGFDDWTFDTGSRYVRCIRQ